MGEISIGLAFAAGFISFISPCVLPLVPAYIGYMGGRMTNMVAAQAGGGTTGGGTLSRINTGLHSLFFVMGFTLVFVSIGLLSTAFIQQVGGQNLTTVTNLIGRVGGVIIIFFGLHFMDGLTPIFNWVRKRKGGINILASIGMLLAGAVLIFWAFDIPPSPFAENPALINRMILALPVFTAYAMWLLLGGAFTKPREFWLGVMSGIERVLYADTRREMSSDGRGGLLGSGMMGVVFAAGWTPCIGPIYGAILTLAANGGDISTAGVMLTAYSLGLGIPFIMTALLLDSAQGFLRGLQKHMRTIKTVSGVFLIIIGLMIASNRLQRLSALATQGELGAFSFRLEECFTGAVAGDVAWGSVVGCTRGDEGAMAQLTLVDLPETAGVVPEIAAGDATGSLQSIEEAAETNDNTVPSDVEVGLLIGNMAPDFQTFTDTGEEISLSDLRGQTVLLNFWATWCGPCRIEMPEFQEAFEEHNDDGFTILAVNNREGAAQVLDFREELDLTFPMAMDLQGQIQDQFGVQSYPSTYLIDANGIIQQRHFGALTRDQISELIDDAVAS